jgi:hypothetical protein
MVGSRIRRFQVLLHLPYGLASRRNLSGKLRKAPNASIFWLQPKVPDRLRWKLGGEGMLDPSCTPLPVGSNSNQIIPADRKHADECKKRTVAPLAIDLYAWHVQAFAAFRSSPLAHHEHRRRNLALPGCVHTVYANHHTLRRLHGHE